ncbi:MAG: aminotransferase class IV [Rikenellaceae bacterium]|nr:aminotransferase class IV [Rikenellaceae bacterium]
MPGEYICINGHIHESDSCGSRLLGLLGANYTYRSVHTLAGRPLHIDAHLALLGHSYESLYGYDPAIERAGVERWIGEVLYRNSASRGSNLIRIVAAPDGEGGGSDIFIFYLGPMMYQGYSLWHKPRRALPLTYEVPFPAFRTAANLTSHNYAHAHARRLGYDAAITVNYAGEAVSLGEDPLFCVRGREVFVADAETRIPQSVERLLGIEVCRAAGLEVHEQAVAADELTGMDELFAFSPQGLVPVGSVGEHLLPSAIVNLLGDRLPGLQSQELTLF